MDTLANFEQVLARAQELFLRENSLLKAGQIAEHATLMAQKKKLLTELDSALKSLQALRKDMEAAKASPYATRTGISKDQLRTLQDRVMQLLMLDKENEQLLLKRSMTTFSAGSALEKLSKAL